MANDQATSEVQLGTENTWDVSYFFHTDKVRDDEGKVIGTGRKHPDVKATFKIPTYADLGVMLKHGGKEAELLLDAVKEVIYAAGRQQINEFRETNGPDKDFTINDFDHTKLNFSYIATTPKAERAGPAISEDDWTAFLQDYTHVMVHVVGYEPERVKLAVMHFKVQLRRIRNDKPAVKKLLDLLNVWASKTENLDDYIACFDDLTKRANKYLIADEKNVAAAL